jgi:hypothetical protein
VNTPTIAKKMAHTAQRKAAIIAAKYSPARQREDPSEVQQDVRELAESIEELTRALATLASYIEQRGV